MVFKLIVHLLGAAASLNLPRTALFLASEYTRTCY